MVNDNAIGRFWVSKEKPWCHPTSSNQTIIKAMTFWYYLVLEIHGKHTSAMNPEVDHIFVYLIVFFFKCSKQLFHYFLITQIKILFSSAQKRDNSKASDSITYHTIGAKGQQALWHLQITQMFSLTHKKSNISKTVKLDIGLSDWPLCLKVCYIRSILVSLSTHWRQKTPVLAHSPGANQPG